MRGALRTTLAAMLGLALIGSAAAAAEIRVLSVGATTPAMKQIAADFTKETGIEVKLDLVPPAQASAKLAGAPYDVAILSRWVMDAEEKSGGIKPGSRHPLSRTGIGIGIRDGAAKPDLSSAAAFKKTVLAARAVAYRDPLPADQSGGLTERILADAGILDQVKAKAKIGSVGMVHDVVAKGEVDLGFFNVSETNGAGVVLAGPVPEPLQQWTNHDVAILAKAAPGAPCDQFIAYVAGPKGGAIWRQAGFEMLSGK
jgi:molybdate transport system substrate-binding protein